MERLFAFVCVWTCMHECMHTRMYSKQTHKYTDPSISRKWCVVWASEWVVFVQCRKQYVYFHRYCHCFPWNSFELIRCALDLGKKEFISRSAQSNTRIISYAVTEPTHILVIPNIFAAFVIFSVLFSHARSHVQPPCCRCGISKRKKRKYVFSF